MSFVVIPWQKSVSIHHGFNRTRPPRGVIPVLPIEWSHSPKNGPLEKNQIEFPVLEFMYVDFRSACYARDSHA